MKKSILVAGFSVAMMAASAQTVGKEEPPKPPPPPKPLMKKMKELPPPPPPPPDAPPPPDVAPPPPPDVNGVQLPNGFNEFMKRNKDVQNVHWKNNEIFLRLKSGKEERYDLNDAQSVKAAEAKYGALPQPPPPPAPKPPKK